MSQMMPGDPLTEDMLRLIAHLASPLGEASTNLRRQAARATVVHYSATMLDVEVPTDVPPLDLPDGPVPASAYVYEGDRLVGELLLWIRDGFVNALEQAWYTDYSPRSWPSPEAVQVS